MQAENATPKRILTQDNFKKIKQAIDAGDTDNASVWLREQVAECKVDVRLVLLTAFLAEKKGNTAKAAKLFETACKLPGDSLVPVQGLIRTSMALGDFEVVKEAINMAEERGIDDFSLVLFKIRAAAFAEDMDTASELFDEFLAGVENADRVMHIFRRMNQPGVTMTNFANKSSMKKMLKMALDKFPDSTNLNSLYCNLLMSDEENDSALQFLEQRYNEDKDNIRICYQYLRALAKCHQHDRRRQIYEEQMEIGVRSSYLFVVGAELAQTDDEVEELAEIIREYIRSNELRLLDVKHCASALMLLGKWDETADLLDEHKVKLRSGSPNDRAILALQKLLRSLTPPKGKAANVFADDDDELAFYPCPGADSTLIVFTGLNDALMLPLPVAHTLFQRLNCNLIYVNDKTRSLCLGGLTSLGLDLEQSLDLIRSKLISFGSKRLYTLGNSAGGFAATLWGKMLGAEAVLSFSGPTNANLEFVESKDSRARSFYRRLNNTFSKEMLDISNLLTDGETNPRIVHYYCEDHGPDAAHALYVQDLDAIELRPLPGDIHSSFLILVSQGEFFDVAKEIFDLP